MKKVRRSPSISNGRKSFSAGVWKDVEPIENFQDVILENALIQLGLMDLRSKREKLST